MFEKFGSRKAWILAEQVTQVLTAAHDQDPYFTDSSFDGILGARLQRIKRMAARWQN
jgi:hypothetical protein